MKNTVEEFPGQITQLESYIRILEVEQTNILQENRQLRDKVAQMEAQVFGGTTK